MTIELKVGQKVKFRNGETGYVVRKDTGYFKVTHDADGYDREYYYSSDGYFRAMAKVMDLYDVIEILDEEETTMETKVRYFKHNFLMYIQNVKESSITIVDTWAYEVLSVMDYGTALKAKEQMYTYATLYAVDEVKTL